MRPDFQPIPAGYHAIIAAWLESPEEFLSATRIQFRVKQPAYMHLDRMCREGLLEQDSPGYRPTKKGWTEFYDYESFHEFPRQDDLDPGDCPNWR
jgi:hypothetical protein